jgi:N-acetylneuraminic acid mutarotase
MPTKRYHATVICSEMALIVAGGSYGNDQKLKTVEILSTETQQCYTATNLPEPLSESSLILCGDLVYLLGGMNKDHIGTNSVYSCSLTTLLSSAVSKSVDTAMQSSKGDIWSKVADLPVMLSTGVSFNTQLLAIGGKDSKGKPWQSQLFICINQRL